MVILIALACTGAGAGLRCYGVTPIDVELSINRWGDKEAPKLKGQYFVFIMELFYMLGAAGLCAYRFLVGSDRNKLIVSRLNLMHNQYFSKFNFIYFQEQFVSISGAFIMFICACLEVNLKSFAIQALTGSFCSKFHVSYVEFLLRNRKFKIQI